MSMRLLNGYPVCKVNWIKNGPLGDFLNIHYWHFFFSLQCREDEWIEKILRRRKFWAQSGVNCSILRNNSFLKNLQLAFCFNDCALW